MIKTFSVFLSLAALSSAAQPLEISKSYWQGASFRKAFNGSYGINARIEPHVTQEQRALLLKVQNAMQNGKREQAYQLLTNSAQTKNSAALLYNLANISFELDKNDKALTAYQEAIKKFPSFRRAHKNLGMLYLKKGEQEKATVSLQKALELGDNSGATMGMLGYCYLQKKQFASALQAYRMAQLTEPAVVDWKAGVAQCLSEIGKDEEALALLEEVIEQRPTEASYQLLFANVLLELEREKEAAVALELLRRDGGLDYSSLALLAQLHVRADAMPLAKPLFSQLQKGLTGNSVPSYLQSVEAVIQHGEWQYAESLLATAEVKAKSELESKLQRLKAFVWIQQGKDGAEDLLREILRKDAHDGEALLLLAEFLAAKNQLPEAELLYERAAKIDHVAYRALVAHGKMLVSKQRYVEALIKLKKSQSLNSTDVMRRYINAVERVAKSS